MSFKEIFNKFDKLEKKHNYNIDILPYVLKTIDLIKVKPTEFKQIIEQLDYTIVLHQEYTLPIEAAAYLYFYNNPEFKKIESLKLLLLVLKAYPYGVYNLMLNRDIEQQKQIIKSLLELESQELNMTDKFKYNITILQDYCNEYYEKRKTNSCLYYLNNLIGIKFNRISVDYSQLPKKYLMVNIGYNNVYMNTVYLQTEYVKNEFLTLDEATKYKPLMYTNVCRKKECCEMIGIDDSEFNIVINYCNNPSKEKCLYSISETLINKNQLHTLLNGGIIKTNDNKIIDLYFNKRFYERNNLIDTEYTNITDELTVKRGKLGQIYKKLYDPDVVKTIENWKKQMPKEKYFHIFLDRLRDCLNDDGQLDYTKYVQTIDMYQAPSINIL